jgi:hypothetical protein
VSNGTSTATTSGVGLRCAKDILYLLRIPIW